MLMISMVTRANIAVAVQKSVQHCINTTTTKKSQGTGHSVCVCEHVVYRWGLYINPYDCPASKCSLCTNVCVCVCVCVILSHFVFCLFHLYLIASLHLPTIPLWKHTHLASLFTVNTTEDGFASVSATSYEIWLYKAVSHPVSWRDTDITHICELFPIKGNMNWETKIPLIFPWSLYYKNIL